MRKITAVAWMSMWAFGCSEPSGEATNNRTCKGKCDANSTLVDALEGRNDPVAQWLRDNVNASGEGVDGDLVDLLYGVNEKLGCAPDEVKTYIVSDKLLGEVAFPRTVSTVCSGNDRKHYRAFVSAPSSTEAGDDIDLSVIETFAWDDETDEYRFYKLDPHGDGSLFVDVEPDECVDCHIGPKDLMKIDASHTPMMPVMNELREPWSHWSATPTFVSQEFSLPDGIEGAEGWKRLMGDGDIAPASQLEQIIRNAQGRVVSTRYKSRRNDATVAGAMALLRPVFCAEQLNYVSERGDSGLFAMAPLMDDSIRTLYQKVNATQWPYEWFFNQTISVRFESPKTPEERIVMMPVRGNIDRELEAKLTRTLTPQQLMSVRALDWHNAALSEFRCGLWISARERLSQNPPTFDEGASNADVLPQLFDEIMKLDGENSLLIDGDEMLILDKADAASLELLKMGLASNDFEVLSCTMDEECRCDSGVCVGDLNQFGPLAQTYIEDMEMAGREAVRKMRQEVVCKAKERFDNQPFLEDSTHCD